MSPKKESKDASGNRKTHNTISMQVKHEIIEKFLRQYVLKTIVFLGLGLGAILVAQFL